jgi:hypothetical protein
MSSIGGNLLDCPKKNGRKDKIATVVLIVLWWIYTTLVAVGCTLIVWLQRT